MYQHRDNIAPHHWLCIPCHQELLVVRVSEYERLLRIIQCQRRLTASDLGHDGFFVPGGHPDDVMLPEPPLAVFLDDEEARALRTGGPSGPVSALAATDYGPGEQDKKSNEDFALSAVVTDRFGGPWAFSAVADGVSTRTFWAARSSRLACLVAYKVVRRFLEQDPFPGNEEVTAVRADLAGALREALDDDRGALLLEKDLSPAGWAPDLYRQYEGRTEYWYNTTLLVACLGPRGGFVLFAGDGGIVVRKHLRGGAAPLDATALKSSDELTIQSFVSLDVKPESFRIGVIKYPDDLARVEVFLGSDGVDRTLQRNPEVRGYAGLTLFDTKKATRQLASLYGCAERETDNYSVARVTLDLERMGPRAPRPQITPYRPPAWSPEKVTSPAGGRAASSMPHRAANAYGPQPPRPSSAAPLGDKPTMPEGLSTSLQPYRGDQIGGHSRSEIKEKGSLVSGMIKAVWMLSGRMQSYALEMLARIGLTTRARSVGTPAPGGERQNAPAAQESDETLRTSSPNPDPRE